ncbi:conserved virulence factor C family protein [Falsibacillus pallidus]|uniref:HEAT repeat protein n=1 Tax=Falsibacillus pallidus TaxID=493781 RepID=A0A370GHD8_9BACI|nr:conserved virulence factor C family protein [Falsibacillus pallidus]RDI43067.1 HEAT repeat protein [Falsibacillus pallidus]
MNIKSIEPTPSPNTMKIILNQELPSGKSNNYKKETASDAPKIIQDILEIEGVKGVYHVADFLAVERYGKVDWQEILPKVRTAFGEEADAREEGIKPDEHFGEVNASVQFFKGIPMQIKLTDGNEERRFGLPEAYITAVGAAQKQEDNVVLARKWKDYGIRYGELDQIGQELKEEIVAAYPQSRLDELVSEAQSPEKKSETVRQKKKVTVEMFDNPDWRKRYQLLDQMDDPELEDLPLLEQALNDEKPSIRRLAVVYLGMIEDKSVLPFLYKGLKDKTVMVRRTAGDCLSDLGYEEAMEEMMEALKDTSKIVRWRAAMFLYEVGDETALPALKNAENDPEFEVSLQVKMAIERIEGGEEAKGSVWKQMTEARNKKERE